MKNTKKIVSLILAVCMIASLAISASAANTVDASGGTGTSSVTLSSTADGSIGGDPAATKMSVTVPTVLPIAVGTDGTVSTATDAKIVNNSFGAVKVNSVSIEAAQGWSLAARAAEATQDHVKDISGARKGQQQQVWLLYLSRQWRCADHRRQECFQADAPERRR